LARTTFWTRKSEPYVEEEDADINKSSTGKSEDGFTNLASLDSPKIQVFSVEEKKVFRDPNMDKPDTDDGRLLLTLGRSRTEISLK